MGASAHAGAKTLLAPSPSTPTPFATPEQQRQGSAGRGRPRKVREAPTALPPAPISEVLLTGGCPCPALIKEPRCAHQSASGMSLAAVSFAGERRASAGGRQLLTVQRRDEVCRWNSAVCQAIPVMRLTGSQAHGTSAPVRRSHRAHNNSPCPWARKSQQRGPEQQWAAEQGKLAVCRAWWQGREACVRSSGLQAAR